jgi:hypothetical protein
MSGRKYSVFHISQVEFKEGEKDVSWCNDEY